MKLLSKALFFFAVCLLISTQICAASCELPTVEQSYRENDRVFVGKAGKTSYENIGGLNPKSRTAFEISSVLKGETGDSITVVTTAGSILEEGKEYLVYAYRTTKNDYLYEYKKGEYAIDLWCKR